MAIYHSWAPEWSICPKQFFFLENYYYHSHLPITPFHCAKLKKILPADSELREYAIFGPISPTEHFFFSEKLVMSLVSFIHAYLHAKNQSQILIY